MVPSEKENMISDHVEVDQTNPSSGAKKFRNSTGGTLPFRNVTEVLKVNTVSGLYSNPLLHIGVHDGKPAKAAQTARWTLP
jgi:hypothetical protein